MSERKSSLERSTKETRIEMALNLDGSGRGALDLEIPFFEHMLGHLVRQSFIDLDLKLRGDIEIDCHHSVEDAGIVLGNLFREALGDRKGIARYGHCTLPMDEVLVTVAVDLSGRSYFRLSGQKHLLQNGKFGIYDAELTEEFFQKFASNARMNLHVLIHYGENKHHIHEAVFKATGRAIAMAVALDPRLQGDVLSTKGVLE